MRTFPRDKFPARTQGWKLHEILLNTVHLRTLSDIDAVHVHVLHYVSHSRAPTPVACVRT